MVSLQCFLPAVCGCCLYVNLEVTYARIKYVRIYDLCDASDPTDTIGIAPSFTLVIPLDGKRVQEVKILYANSLPKNTV